MKALVVGASGFIGKELCRGLSDRDVDVVGVSLSGVGGSALDITDARATTDFVEDGRYDVVMNLAGVGVTSGSASDGLMRSVNVDGALNLADAVVRCDRRPRLIHLSSSVESQEGQAGPEESTYASTKTTASRALDYRFRDSDQGFTRVTIHNTYGRNQPSGRFIGAAISTLTRGEEFEVRYPSRIRDFCHVSDVAQALADLAVTPGRGDGPLEVGTGSGTSLLDAALRIARLLGADPSLVVEARAGGMEPDEHRVRTADRAGAGFIKCETMLEEGLRLTLGAEQ